MTWEVLLLAFAFLSLAIFLWLRVPEFLLWTVLCLGAWHYEMIDNKLDKIMEITECNTKY